MTDRQILAIGGAGLAQVGARRPLLEHLLALTGRDDPRICYVGTASGDLPLGVMAFYDAVRELRCRPSHLSLFPMPNVPDPRAHLLAQHAVYAGGGSVANLLAVWRVHGLDAAMREAWEAGVVLAGASAGSLCWFAGGTTDSFGTDLRPITDGLALIPASHTPHYDSEEQRRPLYQQSVRDGVLPPGWAADDHVGLHFVGTELHEAVTAQEGQRAWRVEPREEREITPRTL